MKRKYILPILFFVTMIGALTSWELQQRKQNTSQQHNPSVGQMLPDFTLTDFDGNPVHSKQWNGEVRLINFWASWCPPCRREIPHFAEVYEFYEDQGFTAIGIAVDEPDPVRKFLSAVPQVTYPQLIGMESAVELGRTLGNTEGALPYSLIVDKKGVIRFVHAGELKKEALLKWVELLLAEPDSISHK